MTFVTGMGSNGAFLDWSISGNIETYRKDQKAVKRRGMS